MNKPLNKKGYGSIPHLPNSKLGIGDHHITEGQANIATIKPRDSKDIIIIQEKLDGSCVCITKHKNKIIPLIRKGYLANTSPYKQHLLFDKWVNQNYSRFDKLLKEGDRLCGEWLAQAHGTIYELIHEPFVAFDLFRNNQRLNFLSFINEVLPYNFIIPNTFHIGSSLSVEDAFMEFGKSAHGAIDKIEGLIYRVERNEQIDFLAKYINHDYIPGKYFPKEDKYGGLWNLNLNKYINNEE